MVDNISNTRGIGRGVTRYAPSPASSTEPVRPAPDSTAQDDGSHQRQPEAQTGEPQTSLRLEISEDPNDGELVYRFVDAASGEVVRQWDSRDLGRLREYVRAQRIHLIDKKV